jgi:hypothetical protein
VASASALGTAFETEWAIELGMETASALEWRRERE